MVTESSTRPFSYLAEWITRDYLGVECSSVVATLLRLGRLTLPQLAYRCISTTNEKRIKPSLLKDALRTLIQNNIATHSENDEGAAVYTCEAASVFRFALLPQFVAEYENEEEQAQVLACAKSGVSTLEDLTSSHAKDMLQSNAIIPCTSREAAVEGDGGPSAQKQPRTEEFYRLNIEQFCAKRIDSLIVQLAEREYGEMTGSMVSVCLTAFRAQMVKTDATATPAHSSVMYGNDLYAAASKRFGVSSKSVFDQCMNLVTTDERGILVKQGESGGGEFMLDYYKACVSLATAVIESYIQENFGSHGLRIFRLLQSKKYLEQHDIESGVLLPSTTAKTATYAMLAANIISVKEVPKSGGDFAPSRTVYVFHVRFDHVVRLLLQRAYKMAANAIQRRLHLDAENSVKYETVLKAEELIKQIEENGDIEEEVKQAQISEIRDGYLPAATVAEVELQRSMKRRLIHAEILLLQDILILQTFVDQFERRNS